MACGFMWDIFIGKKRADLSPLSLRGITHSKAKSIKKLSFFEFLCSLKQNHPT
jgi:hypothetical protein